MTIRPVIAVLALAVVAPANSATAQNPLNGIFRAVGELLGQPPQRPAVPAVPQAVPIRANVDADFTNMYTPFLSKVLTAELHFVNKVCEPTEQQFATIHRAGLLAVAITSKHYDDLQKIGQNANQWPDPRVQIDAALQQQIDKTLSAEVAQRYRQEIAAPTRHIETRRLA